MLLLKDLLAVVERATDDRRQAFLAAVNSHPTWFIWSLAALPAKSSDPRAQRIAFLHVEGAEKFTFSLSNVAGIRVFDNAKSNYLAVDLLAYERAAQYDILGRREKSFPELVRELPGKITLIDYFAPPIDSNPPAAFVWLGGANGPAWEKNYAVLAQDLQLTPLRYTKNLVRATQPRSSAPLASPKELADFITGTYGAFIRGALPAYELVLRSEDALIEATKKLREFLNSGQNLNEVWTIERISTYDAAADADWRKSVHLPAAWAKVGETLGPEWFQKCMRAIKFEGGEANEVPTLGAFVRPNVVLLDTTVDFDHPALFHTWMGSGDAALPHAEALSDQLRRNYHGTACASLIAGFDLSEPDESAAFRGVGAGAFIGSIRVRAGSSSNDYGYPEGGLPPYLDADLTNPGQIQKAILAAAANNAHVICISFQYNNCTGPQEEDAGMRLIRAAIREVTEAGVCVVVAAGNALHPKDTKLHFPAYLEDVIAVAATREGTRETEPGKGDFYNCWLASRTICAQCPFDDPPEAADAGVAPKQEDLPGAAGAGVAPKQVAPPGAAGAHLAPKQVNPPGAAVAHVDPKQEDLPKGCQGGSGCWKKDCLTLQSFGSRWEGATLAAPGTNIWAADVSDFGGIKLGGAEGNYIDFYATSAAAPIVAGTVALMLMVKPGLKPARVKAILADTARARPVKVADWAQGQRLTMDFGFLDCAAAVAQAAAEP